MKHIALALAWVLATSLPAQTESVPTQSLVAEALSSYQSYASAQPDSVRAGKLFHRWEYFWSGRLDENQSPTTLLQEYQNYQPSTSGLDWSYAGPGDDVTQNQGRVECAVTPEGQAFLQELLLGTPTAGIWRSSDGGATWHNTTDDDLLMPGVGCSWLTYDPNDASIVYAAISLSTVGEVSSVGLENGYGLGIFKSTDAGETWAPTPFQFAPEDRQLTSRILINPENSEQMYAAVNGQVYRTNDSWNSWTMVFDELTQSYPYRRKIIADLAADPQDFNSLWITSTGMESWTYLEWPTSPETFRYHSAECWHGQQLNETPVWYAITQPMHPESFDLYSQNSLASKAELEVTPGVITLAYKLFSGDAFIWQSTDNGASWSLKASYPLDDVDAIYQFGLVVDPENSDRVFCGQRRVYSIDLNDESSYAVLNGPHVDTRFLSVLSSSAGLLTLLQGNDGGLARIDHDSNGFSWTNLNGSGLGIQQLFGLGLVQEPNPRVVCGSQDNSAFRNLSTGWDQFLGGDRYDPVVHPDGHGVIPINPSGITEFDNVHASDFASQAADPSGGNYYHRPMRSDTLGNTYAAYSDLWRWSGPGTEWTSLSNLSGGRLRAMDVSSDGQVAVVAEKNPTWGGNTGKLFLCSQLNSPLPLWVDISPHISESIGSMGVNALAFHPLNPQLLAVGFEQFDGGNSERRVLLLRFSDDFSSCETQAIGTGLPNVPVNVLRFEPGPQEALWLGNDVGIFVWEEEGWISQQGNMPRVFVSDIEFDTYAHRVWISTFGRGLWNATLPCETGEPVTLSADQVWGDYHVIEQPVVIPNGVTLTITGKAFFTADAGLTVEPGGKLHVAGGCLGSACEGELWPGITALGNPDFSQHPSHQAVVQLDALARICDAEVGVACGLEDGTEGGAILTADQALFTNCPTGIALHPYRNAASTGQSIAQETRVTRTQFKWDNALISPAKSHLFLDRTNHSQWIGCSFVNESGTPAGTGIRSRNAQWSVDTGCTEPLGPEQQCSGESLPTQFVGLWRGVDARSWLDTETFAVHDAEFSQTTHGIRSVGVMLAEITENRFSIPDGDTDAALPAYGLHMLGCSGYRVEGNEFQAEGEGNYTAGLLITDSEDSPNEIYRNTFEHLEWACLAQGDNRDNTPNPDSAWDPSAAYSGLQFLCNAYLSNQYDISVTLDGAIAHYQGNPDPASPWGVFPAHNLWDGTACSDANRLHVNPGSNGFEYFFPETESALIPPVGCYSNPEVGLMELQPEILPYETFIYEQVCAPTAEVTSVTEGFESAVEAWSSWELVDAEVKAWVDQGDTPSMLSWVQTPTTDAKEIRVALLSQAPWTSNEVLLALADLETLTMLDRYALLAAHSPLDPAVWEHVQNAWVDEPYWLTQMESLQHAEPHALGKQKGKLLGYRSQALAQTHASMRQALQADITPEWAVFNALSVSDACAQRLRLALIAKAEQSVPSLSSYPATDPFSSLFGPAEFDDPDALVNEPPSEFSWRSAALHPFKQEFPEPFEPAVQQSQRKNAESLVAKQPAPWPNPTRDGWWMPSQSAGLEWKLLNQQGQTIARGTTPEGTWFLPGVNLPSGLYILRLNDSTETLSWKLIRE